VPAAPPEVVLVSPVSAPAPVVTLVELQAQQAARIIERTSSLSSRVLITRHLLSKCTTPAPGFASFAHRNKSPDQFGANQFQFLQNLSMEGQFLLCCSEKSLN
jgi:hypothetical protein